jgi:hypothetical protein
MIEMIIVFSYSKNNQKKYIDNVTMFCESVRVLLAEADEFRLCGRNHNLLFEIKKLFALVLPVSNQCRKNSVAIMQPY